LTSCSSPSTSRLEDDTHRAEVTESSEKTFRSQILLDSIVEAEEIKVSQQELTNYLVQGAAQYGMEPGEFIQVLDQNGQIPGMIAEVARVKALAAVLSKAKVVDSKGKVVDVSEFTASVDDSNDADFIEAVASEGDSHEHGDVSAKDAHGRKQGHEHYGHDHK
jgi:trigger factor